MAVRRILVGLALGALCLTPVGCAGTGESGSLIQPPTRPPAAPALPATLGGSSISARSGGSLGASATFTPTLGLTGYNAVGFQHLTIDAISGAGQVLGLAYWTGTTYQFGNLTVPEINALGTTRGYWLFTGGPTSFTYSGNDLSGNRSAQLGFGWNLVAFPAQQDVLASTLQTFRAGQPVNMISVIATDFFEVNTSNQNVPVNVLAPGAVLRAGRPYWVYAAESVTLSYTVPVPTPTPVPSATPTPTPVPSPSPIPGPTLTLTGASVPAGTIRIDVHYEQAGVGQNNTAQQAAPGSLVAPIPAGFNGPTTVTVTYIGDNNANLGTQTAQLPLTEGQSSSGALGPFVGPTPSPTPTPQPSASPAVAFTIERVSRTSTGGQTGAAATRPSVTRTGDKVAWTTLGALIPSDTNGRLDVYVVDRTSNQLSRASEGSNGQQSPDHSDEGRIAPGGEGIAFSATGANIFGFPKTDGGSGVFYKNLSSLALNWLSHPANNPNGSSTDWRATEPFPVGSLVALVTPGFAGFPSAVGITDTSGGPVAGPIGWPGAGSFRTGFKPQLSADGAFTLFEANPDGFNGNSRVFRRTNASGTIEEASVNDIGQSANARAGNAGGTAGYGAAISGNGRFVTFQSEATNLVSGVSGGNGLFHIYVRDMDPSGPQPRTTAVDRNAAGVIGNLVSVRPSISDDGRFVCFLSNSVLTPDSSGVNNIYVKDRQTGAINLVSRSLNGQVQGADVNSMISGDGRFVVFISGARLVPEDTDNNPDVYIVRNVMQP